MSEKNVLSSILLTNMRPNQQTVQNENSVFVRVLSQGKGNEYIVSFAGNKYTVFSERQLHEGTAFRAFVSSKDGKIFLTPQSTQNQSTVQKFSTGDTQSLANLTQFLQDLGLKPDSISLRIIQSFQAFGISFDAKLASKARSIALAFPGSEEDATEIALFLEQKGIQADIDTVMRLLKIVYGDNFEGNEENRKQHENENESEKIELQNEQTNNVDNVKEENDHNYASIITQLFNTTVDALSKQTGLITFVNHSYTNPHHWIILPFEFGGEQLKITGTIRILLHVEKKNTEKMIISAFLGGKNYTLMVKYTSKGGVTNKQRCIIQFCSDKPETIQNQQRLVQSLKDCLPKDFEYAIEYSGELLGDGIFTIGSNISVVKLDV